MKYEEPVMEVVILEEKEVFTLLSSQNGTGNTIDGGKFDWDNYNL